MRQTYTFTNGMEPQVTPPPPNNPPQRDTSLDKWKFVKIMLDDAVGLQRSIRAIGVFVTFLFCVILGVILNSAFVILPLGIGFLTFFVLIFYSTGFSKQFQKFHKLVGDKLKGKTDSKQVTDSVTDSSTGDFFSIVILSDMMGDACSGDAGGGDGGDCGGDGGDSGGGDGGGCD